VQAESSCRETELLCEQEQREIKNQRAAAYLISAYCEFVFRQGWKSRSSWPLIAKELRFVFMGMFTNLMAKIFGHATALSASSVAPPGTTIESATAPTPTTPAASAVSSVPSSTPIVDVTAILDDLAAKNPEKLDWRKSIVDLMKLVDMDSSLSARKQLATELHYSGNENDSAAMNVWLHKEVITKLAENGGKVPQELLS
jgi:hypothetical protein